MDILVGKVTHYYNKIGVAIVQLSEPLAVGDKIKIVGHGKEFTQQVTSMQMEHKEIKEAKKGDVVGLKVDQPVKEKDQVFKIE